MPFTTPTLVQEYLAQNGILPPEQLIWNPATTMLQQVYPEAKPFGIPPEAAQFRPEYRAPVKPEYQMPTIKQMTPPIREMISKPSLMENPALAGVPQQPEKTSANPIAQGIEAARQAPLQERLALSPQQQQHALQMAAAHLTHGALTSPSTNTNTLGRLAENAYPALMAYEQQKAAALQANLAQHNLEREIKKEEFEQKYKMAQLENETKKAEAYNKYMTARSENKPMTETQRRAQQNLIKNTITHINKFRQQDLKEAKKELEDLRVNGQRIRTLPPAEKKAAEDAFWAEKNASYNNTIRPYLDILKKNHALGADVMGVDFKSGKEIVDENYEGETMPTPDEEIPETFNMPSQNPSPAYAASNLPPPESLTPEQRKAILAQYNQGR